MGGVWETSLGAVETSWELEIRAPRSPTGLSREAFEQPTADYPGSYSAAGGRQGGLFASHERRTLKGVLAPRPACRAFWKGPGTTTSSTNPGLPSAGVEHDGARWINNAGFPY
jgi:hypothetical protein